MYQIPDPGTFSYNPRIFFAILRCPLRLPFFLPWSATQLRPFAQGGFVMPGRTSFTALTADLLQKPFDHFFFLHDLAANFGRLGRLSWRAVPALLAVVFG
jgi:hypothetical protein